MIQLIYCQVKKNKTPIKFIISGLTAAGVDFFILYFFHSILFVHVVLSATVAYGVAFFVSFYLQKFWTFNDNNKDRLRGQILLYLIVGLTNLSINACMIYLLVEKYDTWLIARDIMLRFDFLQLPVMIIDKYRIWYMCVQGAVAGILSIGSFLAYKFLIFKKCKEVIEEDEK